MNGKEETDGRFRSETLTVSGDFTGTFGFDTLPQGVHIYDAATDTEITGKQNLEVGKQFYIRYTGKTDVSVLQLSYSYDTHEVFYLKTNNSVYQDMVGTEVKLHIRGTLNWVSREEATALGIYCWPKMGRYTKSGRCSSNGNQSAAQSRWNFSW